MTDDPQCGEPRDDRRETDEAKLTVGERYELREAVAPLPTRPM